MELVGSCYLKNNYLLKLCIIWHQRSAHRHQAMEAMYGCLVFVENEQ